MEYYHGTDLLTVGEIMRNGLKCGYDGNIWVYNELSLTHSVAMMLSNKSVKDLSLLQTADSLQIESSMQQLYIDVAMCIIKIDARGITDNAGCNVDGKHLFGIKQERIEPDYLQFIGGYNGKTQKNRTDRLCTI